MWETRWFELTPKQRTSFLARPTLKSIERYPYDQVRDVIESHQSLSEISSELNRRAKARSRDRV